MGKWDCPRPLPQQSLKTVTLGANGIQKLRPPDIKYKTPETQKKSMYLSIYLLLCQYSATVCVSLYLTPTNNRTTVMGLILCIVFMS